MKIQASFLLGLKGFVDFQGLKLVARDLLLFMIEECPKAVWLATRLETIIFRKFDLWWPLLTSTFTWAKKLPKWLRMGSLRALSNAVSPGLLAFLVFELDGGHFAPPPPPWRRWLRPPPGSGLKMHLLSFEELSHSTNIYTGNRKTTAYHIHTQYTHCSLILYQANTKFIPILLHPSQNRRRPAT